MSDDSDVAKLKQLKSYFEQGLIEEEDFLEQKALLLDRIMNKPVRASTQVPRESTQVPRASTQVPRESTQAPRASTQVPRASTQAPSPAKTHPATPSRDKAGAPAQPRAAATPSRETSAARATARPAVEPQQRRSSGVLRGVVEPELAKPPKQRAPDECWQCGERLHGPVVTTPEQQHNYHKDCFVCFVCQSSLVTQPFYPEGDEVVCAKHLGSVGAGVCPKCGLNIDNEYYVEAEGEGARYHPECFVCAYGGCGLDAGWARGADGEVYCFVHLNLLNNSNCVECCKMVTKDAVVFHGRKYHARCFVCAFCQNPLSGNKFYDFQKQPFCYECHTTLHYAKKQ